MRLKISTVAALTFAMLGQPLSAQTQQNAAGAPIAFANGSYRFDDMTVTLQVENPGTPPAPVAADIKLAATPCSATRACGATFDLRVRSITPPPVIAPGVEVPVTIVIDNAGRTPSPAADVALCRGLEYSRAKCSGPAADLFTLPELAPGQTATITRALKLQDVTDAFPVAVVIDPDGMLTEKIRGNNAKAADAPTAVEMPKLEKMDFRAPAEQLTVSQREEGVTFVWRLRNPGRIALVTPLAFVVSYGEDGACQLQPIKRRFEMPAIPPRAVVTVAVRTSPLFARCDPRKYVSRGISIRPENTSLPGARILDVDHVVGSRGQ